MALLIVAVAGCQPAGLKPGEGFVEVAGGRVRYRVVGSAHKPPLLVLNGGPGFPHDNLETLSALASDRPVVSYDQQGARRSDPPSDSTLWRVDRIVEVIPCVREALHRLPARPARRSATRAATAPASRAPSAPESRHTDSA